MCVCVLCGVSACVSVLCGVSVCVCVETRAVREG